MRYYWRNSVTGTVWFGSSLASLNYCAYSVVSQKLFINPVKYILLHVCNIDFYFRYVHVITKLHITSQSKSNLTWINKIRKISQNKIFYESAEIFPVLMPRYFLWPQRSKCVGPPPLLRQNKCDKCGKTARRNKNLERHRQMCTAHLGRPTLCAAQCTKLQNSKRQKYWFGFPHLWVPTKSWCQINGDEYWSGWQIPSFNH